ncbi:SDR family NAD(P)-dependent oxidoreductase [Rhodobacter capsulatus]|jgi:short-subunit dehydrogenase|uniref:Oxidoreductase, short-chain dehydrogenase/reductase family n=1 Tax=Rhodobacter capsulatus (strain ATCC BAA-309 / NBRC 16581 / SB1003) TaxID=272942 RepID=D5AQP0_RHOCB|nr:SDR family NAD(P)-dependent oxidoreductase [Rhodobacter capsulatus]ADE86829.1 oxidoreductase, short-chain dehydrogenase/reductase family [Rhodobacter capsulatus SB 1003]ETD00373.1 short-chain dehydrogenase [Rhodobacter capsulatus DE442]ETD74713.1 short-chain dehydrogenase [Rhodobacter capsulatus R121]ETE52580.1 short-chain dehydrogenase [Rhodobacter capsulatus Y262]MDS0928630.1 SDR family NAD(P)-dependent oxidoreductase [Rhodobacter capsulatus]
MQSWIILGAGSEMARPFLRRLAGDGASLFLAGRNLADLETLAQDLRLRGAAAAEVVAFDARDSAGYPALVARLAACEGVLNAASFVGAMPDQAAIDADPGLIAGVIADNFTGPATFLSLLAPVLEARGAGVVVGIGSVAGDRGRIGNYVYGAAKAGFATYLSGLRNRLGRRGVQVMTVKPGPVATRMTAGMTLPFMTTPEAVAEDIAQGIAKRRNVIYTARIWGPVMRVIRAIPEPIFKKLSI